jgi:hypothetical protein
LIPKLTVTHARVLLDRTLIDLLRHSKISFNLIAAATVIWVSPSCTISDMLKVDLVCQGSRIDLPLFETIKLVKDIC